MPFMISIFFGYVPMLINAGFLYWIDRFEQEPKRLLGFVFMWGALIAAGAAYIMNSIWGAGIYLITGSEFASELTTSSIIAPLIEESLKAGVVLIIFALFHSEFDSIFDGILYAAVAALGFAATENTLYIYEKGYLQNGIPGLLMLIFIRVILVGWQHPFYTAFTGIGLAISRLSKSVYIKAGAPLIGYLVSVLTHSFHNTLAILLNGSPVYLIGTFLDWSGWFMMLIFVGWAILREKRLLEKYLQEEITHQRITVEQYQRACSFLHRAFDPLTLLFRGKYKLVRKFYQICGELAHKKHQYEQYGREGGNQELIQRYQLELASLSERLRIGL